MRLAFRVSYLGGEFAGSQVQPGCRTVEGEFIAACRRLQLFADRRESRFSFAGRTDKGVHARGQICAFDTNEPDRALAGLNPQLPRDCWCTGYAEVAAAFHPRYDARYRTYRYYIPGNGLDIPAMDQASRLFLGRHDFSCLARVEAGQNPERTVLAAGVTREEGFAVFEVTAESFLWNMVRCMATVLTWTGCGIAEPVLVTDLLERRCRDRPPAAPAAGLVLWEVDCGIPFLPLPRDCRSVAYLETTRRHHAVMEKVCRGLFPP